MRAEHACAKGARRLAAGAVAVLAAACLAVPAGAQQGSGGAGGAAAQEVPIDSLLVYEREVFAYRQLRYSAAAFDAVRDRRGWNRVLSDGEVRTYLVHS